MSDAWLPVALALLGALLLGLSGVSARYGFQTSDLLEGTFYTYLASTAIAVPALLLTVWPAAATPRAVGLFLLDGLLGLSAVFLIYIGIRSVGPSVSYALKSTSPLWAIALAIVLLGEREPWPVYLGGMLAVAGVTALSVDTRQKRVAFDRRVLAPMASAGFFGSSYIVRRAALPEVNGPIVGLVIALLVALGVLALAMAVSRRRPAWNAGTRFFVLCGLLQAGGLLSGYTALRHGNVAVVAPLLTSSPLFVLALSPLLLRKMERLTRLKVAGALTVLAGVMVIALGRGA